MKVLALIILFYSFLNSALAHKYENEIVFIDHPWMNIMQSNGAGYFSIKNKSTTNALIFIGAESKEINKIEIHEVDMDGEIMKMRPLIEGMSIEKNTTIEFKPKSYHLMFFGIHKMYKQGDLIDVKLFFKNANTLHIKFKVDSVKSSHNHDH